MKAALQELENNTATSCLQSNKAPCKVSSFALACFVYLALNFLLLKVSIAKIPLADYPEKADVWDAFTQLEALAEKPKVFF